jgi:hypothetical protein
VLARQHYDRLLRQTSVAGGQGAPGQQPGSR